MAQLDDRSSVPGTSLKRRSALHALWATPVVLAATTAPAFALSTTRATFNVTLDNSTKNLTITPTTNDSTTVTFTAFTVTDTTNTPNTSYTDNTPHAKGAAYTTNTGNFNKSDSIYVTYTYTNGSGQTPSGTIPTATGAVLVLNGNK